MDKLTTPAGDAVRDFYRRQGIQSEQKRIYELLFEMGVIRDSMVGQEWLVIYTQDGALDIKRNFLIETATKGDPTDGNNR